MRQMALDNIYLNSPQRWAHTEYSLEYHKDYLARRTGVEQNASNVLQQGFDSLYFDFIWNTNDGIIDWADHGRTTDMGHAAYSADGSDQRQTVERLSDCKGAIIAVGNHLPANIPDNMLDRYFKTLLPRLNS